MTHEVIACKELKQRLSRDNYLMPNQQLVEAEVGIFDSFNFECTDLETNTIRDNDVDHLLSIDSSLFDPTSKIRIDIYYNDLYKYPELKLRGTAIRFLEHEKKSGEMGPLSEIGRSLLEAYFKRVKRMFEKPIDFLQKHFLTLKTEISNEESIKKSKNKLLKTVEDFEKNLLTQQEFTDEFKQKIATSFESIGKKLKCEIQSSMPDDDEDIDLDLVFDHDEEQSDFTQIREFIYQTSWEIEKCLFHNRTILFMRKQMINIFEDKWRERIESSFYSEGKLIIVNNEFIALNPFILLMR